MNRSDFINEIFKFFKNSDEELKKSYDLAFSVKQNINWDKLYQIVLKEAETRYLPSPKWFIERFYRCYKQENYNFYENNNTKVIVTLLDGYKYDFELWNCNKSQQEIREGLKSKFSHINDLGGVETAIKDIQFIKIEE